MLQKRIERLRSEMQARDMDCLALVPGANLYYLTGLSFHLMERPLVGFFPAEGMPAFALPVLEQAKFEVLLYEAHLLTYTDSDTPAEAFEQAIMTLPEIHSIAVEHLRMRVLELKLVQRQVPTALLQNADPVMDVLRITKTDDEIAAMRRAIEIAEQALKAVVDDVRPGMTEREIANRLALALLKGGGGAVPFEPIVLAGPNAALPHGVPGDHKVQPGEVLLIDFGTTYDGYVSDITRTFMIGQPPDDKAQAVYETVRAANAAGLAAAGPGVPCQEVDRAARAVTERAGFGEYFVHRTGHGIGLEGHEGPYIVEGNQTLLEPGHTFTIEPGIYIPGEIGVRIEDDVVITPDGAKCLTIFDRDFQVIGSAGD